MDDVESEARDNVSLRHRLQEMENALEEMRTTQEAQARLLASVIHDIRSPLNVILVASQVVSDPTVRPERKERNSRLLNEAALSINTMCQDVLDYSKLTAGKMALSQQAFSVRDCLENTCEGLRLLAEKKGIQLRSFCDAQVPDWVLGDPGRLRQVLVNLVSNSIKFTHHGSIDVSATSSPESALASAPEDPRVRFEVHDTGMGIHEHRLREIFNPYEQAHGCLSADLGGAGLGLAIARQLVVCMGGELAVASQAGKGTCFSFVAHFKRCQSQESASQNSLQSLQVLIIDEVVETQAEMEAVCLSLGMHPVLASEATEGVRLLEEACDKSCPFPLAIVNMDSGGGDGLLMVEQLHPQKRRMTHFLAFSLRGRRGDALRCQEVGVQAYLTGTIEKELLRTMLALILQDPGPAELVTRHSLRPNTE